MFNRGLLRLRSGEPQYDGSTALTILILSLIFKKAEDSIQFLSLNCFSETSASFLKNLGK